MLKVVTGASVGAVLTIICPAVRSTPQSSVLPGQAKQANLLTQAFVLR